MKDFWTLKNSKYLIRHDNIQKVTCFWIQGAVSNRKKATYKVIYNNLVSILSVVKVCRSNNLNFLGTKD